MFREVSLRVLATLLCASLACLPCQRAEADAEVNPVAVAEPRIDISYRRPHSGLLAAGLVLFTAAYAADIGVTYGYDHQPKTTSLIPFVGPFIQLTEKFGLDGPPVDSGSTDADARINKNVDSFNSTIRNLAIAGAAISGVVQITGLALTITGAVLRRKLTRYARRAAPLACSSGLGGLGLRF